MAPSAEGATVVRARAPGQSELLETISAAPLLPHSLSRSPDVPRPVAQPSSGADFRDHVCLMRACMVWRSMVMCGVQVGVAGRARR